MRKSRLALVFSLASIASIDTTLADCACKYANAISDGGGGACAVREALGSKCQLLWGPPPGGRPSVNVVPTHNAIETINFLTSSARASKGKIAELWTKEEFWQQYEIKIRQIREDKERDLYTLSLATYGDEKQSRSDPILGRSAAIYLVASNILALNPDRRPSLFALLPQIMSVDAPFQQMFDGERTRRKLDFKFEDGKVFNAEFVANGGCFELAVDDLRIASLVKPPWSTKTGPGRC